MDWSLVTSLVTGTTGRGSENDTRGIEYAGVGGCRNAALGRRLGEAGLFRHGRVAATPF